MTTTFPEGQAYTLHVYRLDYGFIFPMCRGSKLWTLHVYILECGFMFPMCHWCKFNFGLCTYSEFSACTNSIFVCAHLPHAQVPFKPTNKAAFINCVLFSRRWFQHNLPLRKFFPQLLNVASETAVMEDYSLLKHSPAATFPPSLINYSDLSRNQFHWNWQSELSTAL